MANGQTTELVTTNRQHNRNNRADRGGEQRTEVGVEREIGYQQNNEVQTITIEDDEEEVEILQEVVIVK